MALLHVLIKSFFLSSTSFILSSLSALALETKKHPVIVLHSPQVTATPIVTFFEDVQLQRSQGAHFCVCAGSIDVTEPLK